jgi:hypothetical protein
MAEPNDPAEDVKQPAPGEDREGERERVRSSNDRDQQLEREGDDSSHNRGYDSAVRTGGVPPAE